MQRHMPLGYGIINGKVALVPETAQIVKAVFQAYLDGSSTYRIAKDLTEQGVLNASHKSSWNHGSIGKILENRKYTGDVFCPPLIDTEIFEQVQRRRQEQMKSLGRQVQPNSFQNQTIFSGKLHCSICGQPYRRYVEHCGESGETVKWKCKHYIKENRVCCRNIFLEDDQIEKAFVHIINQIIGAPDMLNRRCQAVPPIPCPAGEKLTQQIQTVLESGQYTAEEIKRLAFERARAQYRIAVIDDRAYMTEKLRTVVSGRRIQKVFDDELFQQTVRKITVHPEERLRFELLNGMLLDININRNSEEVCTDAGEKEHFGYPGKAGLRQNSSASA